MFRYIFNNFKTFPKLFGKKPCIAQLWSEKAEFGLYLVVDLLVRP